MFTVTLHNHNNAFFFLNTVSHVIKITFIRELHPLINNLSTILTMFKKPELNLWWQFSFWRDLNDYANFSHHCPVCSLVNVDPRMWCLLHIVPVNKAIDLFTYQLGRMNYCLCNETFVLICTVIIPFSIYIKAHLLSCTTDSFACRPAALNQSRVLFDWSITVQANYADAFLL